MGNIKFNKESFDEATSNASSVSSSMKLTLNSTSSVKSSIPSGFSDAASVTSAVNGIETICSKGDNITTTFSDWEYLIDTVGKENLNGTDSGSITNCIKQIGNHVGAYAALFGSGAELKYNFQPGYNFVPGPDSSKHEGGYIVYIPKNYNASKAVGMSLIFHDSGINGSIENQQIAQKLKSGDYEPSSIIILPRAEKVAYNLAAGSKSFPSDDVQNWILELMEGIMKNYNVDMNNITLSASSSGLRGALEFARKNTNYFSRVYIAGTLNVYDYTVANGDSTSVKAVQNVKDLSDAGVEVNLYCAEDITSIYKGYENVKYHKVTGDHIQVIDKVYTDPEFLAAIGGEYLGSSYSSTQAETVNNDESSTAKETETTTETEVEYEEEEKVKETETTTSTKNKESEASTNNNKSNSTTSTSNSTKSTSTNNTHSNTTSNKSTTSSNKVSTPVSILPENKYTDVIPEVTSGKLETMEISSQSVRYEINGINEISYNTYIEKVKEAGYVLNEEGTLWIKNNYSLLLEHSDNELIISITSI